MTSTVSSAAASPLRHAISPSTGTAFDAELSRCEAQLSDWVHCPSSKTPAGQRKIAEITARMDALKSQQRQREETAGIETVARAARSAPSVQSAQGSNPSSPRLALDGRGRFVDVYA